MSVWVFFAVLVGAFLHATWNIIVKGGSNKLFETGMNALGAGIGACFLLPFVPLPNTACLWLLALSCLFHLVYYLCMASAYRVADLSLAYTIMRGSSPILTALVLAAAGYSLALKGWIGVLLLCSGIFMLALQQRLMHGGDLKSILYSLRTSVVIMAYTLADGFGARLAGDGLAYACWIFVLNIFPVNIYLLWSYGREYTRYIAMRGKIGIPGGLAGLASYGIAIWAMTIAPIALVAALRETSVIFGMLLAVVFLGEKVTFLRIAAILLVVCGAILARIN